MSTERLTRCCLHAVPHTLTQCVAWQYPPFTLRALARAPRPVPHSELASAVGPSADRGNEGAGPSEASEVQAGRLVQVSVADIPPGGGRPDMGVGR